MPDAMDRVQAHVESLTSAAIEQHAARTPRRQGLAHCERSDCREPIRPQRTAQGARLCDECQQEHDKRNAHLAVWARRP